MACYLRTGVEYVETMLACFKLRAVPINVNDRYVTDEVADVCADADAVALVADPELPADVDAVAARLPALRATLTVGSAYDDLIDRGSPGRDFPPRSADDHYILYTGGTTGRPKGVVWRHEDIFFAALGGGNAGGPPIEPDAIGPLAVTNRAQRLAPFLPAGDPGPDQFVALALGPLAHASGQWSALGTLLGGGRVVLYPDRHMDMARVLDLVAREQVVMLNLVGDASSSTSGRWLSTRPRAAHPAAAPESPPPDGLTVSIGCGSLVPPPRTTSPDLPSQTRWSSTTT